MGTLAVKARFTLVTSITRLVAIPQECAVLIMSKT